jgi:hypothetical protein
MIRKREMMKFTQKTKPHIKAKKLQRNISRKSYASKKTSYHQMKMKSVTVKREIQVKDSDKEDSE